MGTGTPAAEHPIDRVLVALLLRDQHPDLAALRLAPVPGGWDNALYRLGDDLLVRLPRRRLAAGLVATEHRWLPVVARDLPVMVPVPLRRGRPGRGYPWAWSVVPWLAGRTADRDPPSPDTAAHLAAVLRRLHRPAPADAPHNPFRGVALRERADAVETALRPLAGDVDVAAVRRRWSAAAALPGPAGRVWIHGDLHPRNLLVTDGQLTGILDWGDMTAGDPATDLMAAWALYDRPGRARFRAAYGADDAEWGRAAGWALFFGLVLRAAGLVDDPGFAAVGARMLRRVLDDA